MDARSHRLVRLVAAAAVASALVVPAAAGAAGGGSVGAPSGERPSAALRNDVAHFGNARPTQTAPPPPELSSPVVVSVDGGFDWVSAGVGATGVLGVVVALGVGASALRGRQGRSEARA
jgi:hypothetical protein